MFCTSCGTQLTEGGAFCTGCGKPVAAASAAVQAFGGTAPVSQQPAYLAEMGIPDGVKGWSWGAFLLNWIWAIGNRTWIGLLALVPYIGFIFAIWLGFKGREMAWKNGKWESVEHFNRVQKSWSRWGVGIVVGFFVLGILSAIVIPAYVDYTKRAQENRAAVSQLEAQRPQ
jgi:hypothetical protein